jgi:sulfur carrier protein
MTTGPVRHLEITLNGTALATLAATLADLLDEQGYARAKVATAVNGDFVAERARASTSLKAGDSVEVVTARQGG